ncbi:MULTISPECIES: ABC transporter substrate-binding protein [unclassified Mesorhizobium]|uniref:ABC transporter substrate-binding protein n=1 Tax=unclassified Mesorhizobium TaxID=325217 RepID=UPI000FCCDF1C|nr:MULTISPECIES: ABC transporter substrate-binding protein [unclassified Mesorhizobium]TGP22827.1 ABC transporter substrate-binding protein [Mesorhizobium sp. M1D.F.Ca.ET.231.01.1.1]TGP31226.1 ABC transporter substrate-binding protein [Mesorhizobium sp. M1D.F.Ca.ET.234.01.1.1]TGS45527.1 ABC transporter substrate-binding protein [Mesorhizobium sp. M1D.F.Ca.ET.184.01.1.1]TGS61003.1 ABC transporter substrate-binding protein [Mesorhizobium sp. M1D.F.Ca.ET.183.01.1.1]
MTKRLCIHGLAITGLLASVAVPASAADTITVASWGGTYQEAQTKAFFDPTAKELGITIKQDTTNGLDDVRLQVTGNAVKWDITELGADECARGSKEGLFEKLDYSLIDKSGINPKLVHDDWVGVSYTSVVLIYRTDVFGDKGPKTWADFWDVEKFPGRRALSGSQATETLSVAALAKGTPIDKVYPVDIDGALQSVDKVKGHIDAWWTSGAQAMQLVKDGEVDMASIWNGRAGTLRKEGAPVAFSFDQGVLTADCMVIPKGSKNKDLAMKALARFVSPDLQANLPLYVDNGPANEKAFETGKIPQERIRDINSSPENVKKQVLQDPEFWRDTLVEATEKFNNLIQQ